MFPCAIGGKQPALRGNWQDLATTDPATIAGWWTRRPYNIGIACGPSGLVVTNVIKHAGHSSATVTLDYRDDALVVEVADSGAPGELAARHRSAPGALTAVPGGGRGLLGLRERVLLYGGELDAGSQPEGGWQVRARFPEEPSLAAVPVPS